MIDGPPEPTRLQAGCILDEVESKRLVVAAGIPVVPTRRARSAKAAAALARKLGLPAAVKLASPDATHKSDVDGVRLDLADESAVGAAFEELRARAAAANPPLRFEGVAVQPMARPGVELLLGAYRDPTCGPVVSVGRGGILVEVHDDVALRVAPRSEADAGEMLEELRGRRLLDGYRGREVASRAAIRRTIVCLAALMVQSPTVLEIDINPLFAYADGVLAVDARAVVASLEGAGQRSRTSPQGAGIEDSVCSNRAPPYAES